MVLGVCRGPIYWDLDQKIAKNPNTSSSFFVVFLENFGPLYTGKLVKNPVLGSKSGKKHRFLHILLCAKFNRFFIILGGGHVWPYIREGFGSYLINPAYSLISMISIPCGERLGRSAEVRGEAIVTSFIYIILSLDLNSLDLTLDFLLLKK